MNFKNRSTIWLSNPTSVCIYEDNKITICKDICTCMFIAALFKIGKTWKLFISEWLGQENAIYLYRHNGILFSQKRRKTCPLWQRVWPLENYIKWNKTEKYSIILFISRILKNQTCRLIEWIGGFQGSGVGEIESYHSKGANFHL